MSQGYAADLLRRRLRPACLVLFIISGGVNLLSLGGALYMLQVYDRVLTSHSVDTLIALSALLAGLYLVLAVLDTLRGQLLIRIARQIDAALMPTAHAALLRLPLQGHSAADALQPTRDVDAVRGFVTSQGPIALLDIPWAPLFLLFVWVLSPLLGLLTLGGLVLLAGLTLAGNAAARHSEQAASREVMRRIGELDACHRNADSLAAMGFGLEASRRFAVSNRDYLASCERAGDVRALFGSLSRIVRLSTQAAVTGAGAWLAIKGAVSPGAIIAASIAALRALGPIEQAIAGWRGVGEARDCLARMRALAAGADAATRCLDLPRPSRDLTLHGVSITPAGKAQLILVDISLEAKAGEALAIVGDGGAGKSALVQAIAGVRPVAGGAIKLDGVPLAHWHHDERGRFVGYMPEQVSFFPCTIAENIARLEAVPSTALVVAAATAAGVHDAILALPHGYETVIAADGAPLAPSERRLVGLARALYGDPFLVVLDMASGGLDGAGEQALVRAIAGAKARGAIVVVSSHRRRVIVVADRVAVLEGSRLKELTSPEAFLMATTAPVQKRPGGTRAATLRAVGADAGDNP